jgi:hypothetical protein
MQSGKFMSIYLYFKDAGCRFRGWVLRFWGEIVLVKSAGYFYSLVKIYVARARSTGWNVCLHKILEKWYHFFKLTAHYPNSLPDFK